MFIRSHVYRFRAEVRVEDNWAWGLGSRVWGLGFRGWGPGFRVQGLVFRA